MNVMDPPSVSCSFLFRGAFSRRGARRAKSLSLAVVWGADAGRRAHLANAMIHNPTMVSYRGVRVRLLLSYVPDHRPWPFFSVIPWQLDVAFRWETNRSICPRDAASGHMKEVPR